MRLCALRVTSRFLRGSWGRRCFARSVFMGIGNFGNMMKVMNAWNTFKQNHPKFPAFCSAVSKRGIREGSILEVTYISPEGEKLTTNIKVQASDIELLRQISGGN